MKAEKAKKGADKHATKSQGHRNDKKETSKDKAWFDDMNQIEWFPVDPYCD